MQGFALADNPHAFYVEENAFQLEQQKARQAQSETPTPVPGPIRNTNQAPGQSVYATGVVPPTTSMPAMDQQQGQAERTLMHQAKWSEGQANKQFNLFDASYKNGARPPASMYMSSPQLPSPLASSPHLSSRDRFDRSSDAWSTPSSVQSPVVRASSCASISSRSTLTSSAASSVSSLGINRANVNSSTDSESTRSATSANMRSNHVNRDAHGDASPSYSKLTSYDQMMQTSLSRPLPAVKDQNMIEKEFLSNAYTSFVRYMSPADIKYVSTTLKDDALIQRSAKFHADTNSAKLRNNGQFKSHWKFSVKFTDKQNTVSHDHIATCSASILWVSGHAYAIIVD